MEPEDGMWRGKPEDGLRVGIFEPKTELVAHIDQTTEVDSKKTRTSWGQIVFVGRLNA